MYLTQLGAVAALASVSQSFLIPIEMSSADTDIVNALPFEDAVAMEGRVMEINCPGCPVITNINSQVHSMDVESILQLNFSLSHQNEAAHDQLLLNGVQIYPLDPSSLTFMEPLIAPQMVKATDDTWQYASNPKLGYSTAVRRPSTSDNLNLIEMHLKIIEVDERFIKGIPAVDIQLLETPTGKMMLGNIRTSASTSVFNPTDDDRECTTILCKWRAIVADRLAALRKGCGSKRPTPEVRPVFLPKPHHNKHPHTKHPNHGRPRPHGSHRPWRHHNRQGSLSRLLRSIVFHVLVPVLIGVMVGITASLVGMVVGHIVVFTWRMLFRRGQNKYAEIKQDEADEESDDGSKGFLAAQDPPQYEDALDEKKDLE